MLKFQNRFLGGRGKRRCRCRIQRDEINLAPNPLKKSGERPGMLRSIIDRGEQDIFKGDTPSFRQWI
jgi:hypothetical protein